MQQFEEYAFKAGWFLEVEVVGPTRAKKAIEHLDCDVVGRRRGCNRVILKTGSRHLRCSMFKGSCLSRACGCEACNPFGELLEDVFDRVSHLSQLFAQTLASHTSQRASLLADTPEPGHETSLY